ncbi:MAG: hypothetical protein EZS28_038681 [Streblomastix strix]|uniref:Uncharacterized protein n=1 Tax=Streblomastix strix TaxID=222440 RepID=A0A5J4U750_9EUKA|nr:MAG: hypothetical protein EZS28_038681 [Streblomastix strix]
MIIHQRNPPSNEGSNEESNKESNASQLDPKEPDSHIDEGGHAYNTFYIVDDGTCRVSVFNVYFETKGYVTIRK